LPACAASQATVTPPAGQPAATSAVTSSPAASMPPGHWKITWNSDFGRPGALNKWLYFQGGNGWNLKQLQWYDSNNATVDKSGQLVITAAKGGGSNQCWYGPCRYTSARMETKNTFSQKYGLFEARIKLPPGAGLWPAFWIEGANVYQVGWPKCGEVDIVESPNRNPYLVQGYAHAPRTNYSAQLTVTQPFTAGYHTYAVGWNPQGLTWYFDGHAYAHMRAYHGWPFNHKFFIILDLAVGGGYPGSPSSRTPFPAKMIVDWVRVYRAVGASKAATAG
jgi:beta-glucanase (GH16 family)